MPTQGPSTVVAPGTQLTREAPRSNETEQKATPYKIETPLREPTPPPRKVRGPVPLVPKEPKVVGGGIANKPASRLQPLPAVRFLIPLTHPPKINILIDDDLLTSGPEVGVELGREHRTPPKEAKKEKDRKEFGVWFKHFFFW